MKSLKFNLVTFLLVGFISLNIAAQEKSEQLWYCWEETVKPAYLDDYLAMSKQLIEICKQEKFPYAFNTATSKPFVYELWYPVNSMDIVPEIDKAWEKVVEKFGAEKYAAFNNTKVKNCSYSTSGRSDLQYNPKNPDYNRDEANCNFWKVYSLIPGKESEFEEAVKWMNRQRESAGAGHYVSYVKGGVGFDDPLFAESISALSQEDFLKRISVLDIKMDVVLREYNRKINSIIREKKEFFQAFLKDLSYQPEAK